MYLKKIEIQGFKSFADRTTIEFKDNITAIVGPNGSGKSNISDAIRWVLGEQSIKSLRGNKMEDVIFSGTDKRRALGFAEVTIFFDNSDNTIPLDYSEVAVTRRMFRSGESEYYINKGSCRLKDIRQLFMDTGIGKDGYSIIGQGRIDEILSNKPEDRRNIFEEAAGIIKYKTKKIETERKLERTKENLLRIQDIISEVERQYKSLEKESEKATEFVNLYEELKCLDVNLTLREIDKLKLQMDEIHTELELDSQEIENLSLQKSDLEGKFNSIKEKISEIEVEQEGLRNRKADLNQSIEEKKNQINIIIEKEKFFKRDIDRYNQEIESSKNRIDLIDGELLNLEDEIKKISEEYSNYYKEYELKKEEFTDIEEGLIKREKELDDKKSQLISLYNKTSEKKSLVNGIDSFNENIVARIAQLDKDKDRMKEDKLASEKALRELLDEERVIRSKLDEINKRKEEAEARSFELSKKDQDLSNKIREQEIKQEGLISTYRLYKNMEDGYEGYYKSVKNLLQAIENKRIDRSGFEGVLADLLKVDSKYEKAIEISLGSSLQNLVVKDEEKARLMIEYLKANKLGRVTFLPLNIIRGRVLDLNLANFKGYGVIGLGHELIEFDERYREIFEYLLGKTIIVDRLDNGIKLANRLNHNYRIVSLEGDILNLGGSLSGGSYRNNALSIISRKNRIEEVKTEIQNISILCDRLKDEKAKTLSQIDNNGKTLNALGGEIKALELDLLSNDSNTLTHKREIERLAKEISRIEDEIISLENETKDYKTRRKSYESSIVELEEEVNQINTLISQMSQDLGRDRAIRDEKNKELTNFQIGLNQLDNKLSNLRNSHSNKVEEKEERLKRIETLKQDLETTRIEIEKLDLAMVELRKEIGHLSLEEEEVANQLNDLTKTRERLMEEFYKEQEDLKTINDRLMVLEKQKAKREVKHSKFELRIENHNNRLINEYELSYEEALDLEIVSEDLIISQGRISELKARIKSLGNINVGAIEDFKDIKERWEFINKQYEDLLKSKEDLQSLIKKMEKTMEEQFLISFKEINENFSRVFSALFNGGKATLELDTEDDILKSGIEIKVQPPGKKLQNLNLLSGGEKSLTAVALLFAILEARPSPFCILDEIDAALDEANIARYTRYLKNFSQETQFILITHRKTTMEIADILYGVTMVEEGVSRLLSVKIKDHVDDLVS